MINSCSRNLSALKKKKGKKSQTSQLLSPVTNYFINQLNSNYFLILLTPLMSTVCMCLYAHSASTPTLWGCPGVCPHPASAAAARAAHPCSAPLHPVLAWHGSPRSPQARRSEEAATQPPMPSALEDGGDGSDLLPRGLVLKILPLPLRGRATRSQSRSLMCFLTEWPTQNNYKIITQQFSHTDRKSAAQNIPADINDSFALWTSGSVLMVWTKFPLNCSKVALVPPSSQAFQTGFMTAMEHANNRHTMYGRTWGIW